MGQEIIDKFLSLLNTAEAEASAYAGLLASDVEFEALGINKSGRADIADYLAGSDTHRLDWAAVDGRPTVLRGDGAQAGIRGRVITLLVEGDAIRKVWQQNAAVPPVPEEPMVMSDALREKFDTALKNGRPLSISYVDRHGKPHLSLRGSIRTYSEDSLCFWARSAEHGLAVAITQNPDVALLYRDNEAKATYQIDGRAEMVTDAATRQAIFDGSPAIERAHDFAMLGAAILIKLDRVEGWAGLGPNGQIDPIRLIRR